MSTPAAIGIFDSGVGGLTVAKEVMRLLPNEQIIYLGDTARLPYGTKSQKTVQHFTLQGLLFLLEQNVKAVVIACNTASALALENLTKVIKVPLIGVIEPGAETALKNTRERRIGIIGTYSTIGSQAYTRALTKLDPTVTVFDRACPLFVPLVEEGWLRHEATKIIAHEYLNEFSNAGIDTLILGCTHYPLLGDTIQEVVGAKVALIDSGVETASALKRSLAELDLLNPEPRALPHKFYVTDMPDKFRSVAEFFLGNELPSLEQIRIDGH